MRPCNPTTWAPSATGRQLQKSQKTLACPKASPNRRLHRYADPRQHRGANAPACAKKRSFLLDRARPVFFSTRWKRKWGVHPRWTSPLREQTPPPWPPQRRPIPPPPAAGTSAPPPPPPGGPPLPPPPAGKIFLNSQILHRYPLYKRSALRYDNSVSTRRI